MAKRKKTDVVHESNTMEVDRLSVLPDPIIHHILSFLPAIMVIQMSLLSKRWRYMWKDMHVLSFCSANIRTFRPKKFCKFVDKCLIRRKNDMQEATDATVIGFKLVIPYYCSPVDEWLNLVARSKIKELDLHVPGFKNEINPRIPTTNYYPLPIDMLRLRSLTLLKLHSVEITGLYSTSLPSLISLSLENVGLDDEVLHDLLLRCCSLETLVLKRYCDLLNPKISSLSLKFLVIDEFNDQTKFKVECENLESFVCSKTHWLLLKLSSCRAIRHLSFSASNLNNWWLDNLISGLPLLETLRLSCSGLRHVKICSQSLKHLTFTTFTGHGYVAEAVTIDAPSLVSFSIQGRLINFSLNTPELLVEANIILDNWKTFDKNWYTNLLRFLPKLNRSKSVEFHVYSEEALIFPKNLRSVFQPPLPIMKHLKVRTSCPLLREAELRNSLLWIAPSLERLSI
ncbi:hypothetical protein UlMin_014232 [Ulmus minor]